MPTSPGALAANGNVLVVVVSETLKSDEPESLTLNIVPGWPLAPMFTDKTSPVDTVDDPGDQSIPAIFPEVKPVDVEVTYNPFPDVNEFSFSVYAVPVVSADVCVTSPVLAIVKRGVPDDDAVNISCVPV